MTQVTWTKASEAKPEQFKTVITANQQGRVALAHWDGEWWNCQFSLEVEQSDSGKAHAEIVTKLSEKNVEYWMPVPALPNTLNH